MNALLHHKPLPPPPSGGRLDESIGEPHASLPPHMRRTAGDEPPKCDFIANLQRFMTVVRRRSSAL